MDSPPQLCLIAEKASPYNWVSTWAWCVQGRQGGPHWLIWAVSSTSHMFLVPDLTERSPFTFCQVGAAHGQGTMGCPSLQSFITFTQLFPKLVLTNFSWSKLFLSCLTPIPDPTAARGDSAISHQGKTFPKNADIPDLLQCFLIFSSCNVLLIFPFWKGE